MWFVAKRRNALVIYFYWVYFRTQYFFGGAKMKKKTFLLLFALLIALTFALVLCSCNLSDKKDDLARKDKIQTDSRLSDFDDNKISEIIEKYETIAASDEYKNISDKEKDELVNKLIESEKIQQDIKTEQEKFESRKEKNKQQLESLTNSQQELEQRIQDLKNSGASDEEIKAAEEEQQKVEEQIKAAEQEKAYFETVDTVIDTTANNEIFNYRNPGTSIRKMYGIYKFGGRVYINADIIQTEIIGGVEIVSSNNALCAVNTFVKGDESYDQILKNISGTDVVSLLKVCSNKNAESHKEFFEQNSEFLGTGLYLNNGSTLTILESWENDGDIEHPEYIVNCQQEGYEDLLFIITYSYDRYTSQSIEKICPEFWAQLEIEENKQSAES